MWGVHMCHLSRAIPQIIEAEGPLGVDIYNFIKDSAAAIAVLNAAAVDGSENKIEPLDDANLSKSDWLKRAQHTKQNSKQDKEELLDLLKSFQSSPLVDSDWVLL